MDRHTFHHALYVDEELCTGCSNCVRICPTEAIRVRGGKAAIDPTRCIDCGNCYRDCPDSAIQVEQDDLNRLNEFSIKIVLVPSVFIGQFPEGYSIETIYSALYSLGFDVVFEVENGVAVLLEKMKSYLWHLRHTKPLISSYCPAVIRLIQVKFPGLTQHVIRLNTPHDISALYCRKRYMEQGYKNAEIGVFYITPCAAKIAAVKSPVGEDHSALDGVIKMDYLYNRVLQIIHAGGGDYQHVDVVSPTATGIKWSQTRGEAANIEGRVLAVDGIREVSEFLEKVEMDQVGKIDFLELRACKNSCASGILTPGNTFLTVENIDRRALASSHHCLCSINPTLSYSEYLSENMEIEPIEPRPIDHLDHHITGALSRFEELKHLEMILPGIDCGACGAPKCRALAEDIVLGKGSLDQCPITNIQRISEGTMTTEEADANLEKVWGTRIKHRS